MNRPLLTTCLVAFTALAVPAAAQPTGQQVQDRIVAELAGQGFTQIRVSTTFLGRVRIFATSPAYTREIIFNPRTGEILRDYLDDEDDDRGGPSQGGFRGAGATDGDDDRDDARGGIGDDGDDNKDDDSSDDKDDDSDDAEEDAEDAAEDAEDAAEDAEDAAEDASDDAEDDKDDKDDD